MSKDIRQIAKKFTYILLVFFILQPGLLYASAVNASADKSNILAIETTIDQVSNDSRQVALTQKGSAELQQCKQSMHQHTGSTGHGCCQACFDSSIYGTDVVFNSFDDETHRNFKFNKIDSHNISPPLRPPIL